LQHHAKYFTNQDPDYLRKQGKQWSTPITKKTLLLWFLKDLCGMSLIAMIVGKKPRNSRQKPFPRAQSFPKWIKPAYYALFALILTITQSWHLYLLFSLGNGIPDVCSMGCAL
jgi:hypothetical protein